MVGRVSCADADAGQFCLEQMTNCCPVASFIYCEHLSRGLLNDLGAASYVRAETAFSERLQETMRYCALDNTYLRGCSYAYSREEVVHEYALERMELEGRKSAVNVLVAILMLVLGALIMYLTRAALWPGILAGIGSILFLLVLPVAAAEVVVHLIVKARAERFARQLTEGITLPSAGQHQARFSMRAGRILYRDESYELTLDGCHDGREILATEHYLLCPMQNGAMIPVPKSVL